MFGRLLLLFIGIPLAELYLFLLLGSKIGIPTTLIIIVLTAFIGAYLTKSQGLKAYQKYHQAVTEGRLPHEEVMDGLMILLAGAVLLTPGFLTDAIGFSLLVPAVRVVVRRFVKAALAKRVTVVTQDMEGQAKRRSSSSGQRVITVDAEVVEDSSNDSESSAESRR